jgi:hypothetical protein
MDAVVALEAAAGLRTLNVHELLACDVTGNGRVSGLDASMILQYSVQDMPELPVAASCGSEFLFATNVAPGGGLTTIEPEVSPGTCTNGAIVFDDLTTSVGGQDFIAIAIGDCSGDWQPQGGPGGGAAAEIEATGTTAWFGPLHGRDSALRLPLHLEPGTLFKALDVELRYDPQFLLAQRVRLVGDTRGAMFRANLSETGVVRLALASLAGIVTDDSPILVVHFEAADRIVDSSHVWPVSVRVDGEPLIP